MSIAPIAYRFNHGRCVDFFLSALFDPFYFFLAPNRVRQPLVAPRGSSSVAVIALKIFDCCVGCIGSIPIDLSTCQYHHRAIHRIAALLLASLSLCDMRLAFFFRTPEVPGNFSFSGSFLPSSHGLSWLIKWWIPFSKYWPSWLSVLACCGVSW